MSPRDKGPLARILASRTGEWLVANVDEYLERSEKPRVDPGWFHPSVLAHPCDAYLGFEFMGVKPRRKISARLRRIFDNGHARDRDWKRYLQRSSLSVVTENNPRNFALSSVCVRGECDDMV